MDLETRKIRKVETVNYHIDMQTEEDEIQEPYLKLNEDFVVMSMMWNKLKKNMRYDWICFTSIVILHFWETIAVLSVV